MLEVLKNGRLQVRKKFGLIGKRLGWIEDECSLQETPTESVASCSRSVWNVQKLHPIGWTSNRSDGHLGKIFDIFEIVFSSF